MGENLDTSTFNRLYHTYCDSIYNFIYLMVRDPHLAQDILHDTFLKAYMAFDQFEGRSHEKTWLFRIARNVTIDYIRRKRIIGFVNDNLIQSKSSTFIPEKEYELEENARELYDALAKLKQSYQIVIILRKIKEFSISETSHILGWSETKVKSTLLRALNALKLQLEKEGYIHEPILRDRQEV